MDGHDAREIGVNAGMSESPWRVYSGIQTFDIGEEFCRYSCEFVARSPDDYRAQLKCVFRPS